MMASNWIGCAENVLANSNQKQLSVSEIMEAIALSDTFLSDPTAYTSLAAALFSEIQKPGSKFLRSGNKFTLKGLDQTLSDRSDILSSDRGLCNRRRRRTSSRSDAVELPPPVKLTTTTSPPNRLRSSSVSDGLILDTYHHQVARRSHLTKINQFHSVPDTASTCGKQVRFALDRTEVIYFNDSDDLLAFPSC